MPPQEKYALNYSFQPSINQRSKLISQAKAHNDGFNNCYERLTAGLGYKKSLQNDRNQQDTQEDSSVSMSKNENEGQQEEVLQA